VFVKQRHVFCAFLCIALALLLGAPAAWSQSIVTGGIAGVVTDPTGAVVSGAKLTLKSLGTGETYAGTSSSGGEFVFALLKPGDYSLSVTKEGFKTLTRNMTVSLGTTVNANVALEIGSSSMTVEVSAEGGAQLQTENANISSNFETKEIQEIPNPGGDITYVAQTAPGVTMQSSAGGGYGNFSTFGLPGTANLFTLNGSDYNCPFLNLNNSGSSNLLLGGNELQEVSVVNNAYTGQYGRQAGSQIDYSTKSGTNSFHGNLVYNWTGRFLNANDPLLLASGATTRPFENNNQWAASFGGPVIKDKLFFFINNEGIRYIFGSVKPVNTPTPAFENYVLNNLPSVVPAGQLSQTVAFYQNAFKLWNAAPNISSAVPNAGSCSANGLPATGLLSADQCTQSWTDSSSSGNHEYLISARIDLALNDSNKLFGRMKFDRGVQPTYTDPINSAFDTFSIQPQNEGQVNYTHIFSPTVVNNFIGSVLWYQALFGAVNSSSPALSLIPGNLAFVDGSLSNLGFGSGQGGFASGFEFPQGRSVTQWGLVDDLSITRGNHSFKMGVNWRRDDISDYTASEVSVYPAVQTTLAEFANDQTFSTVYNFAKSSVQPVAFYSFGLYFQDEWRATSKLKLTMTLRADRNSGGVCQHACAGLPAQVFPDLQKGADIPYDQSYLTGHNTIIPGVEAVAFQPRFGLAYSVNSKTVLRGGVGLFSDLYPGTILSAIDTNFPQVNLWNVPGGNLAWDLQSPSNTAFPTSGVATVQQCNSAFTSNYYNGGNLNTFLATPGLAAGCATTPAVNDVSRSLKNPKYIEWNVELQRQLTPNTLFSINYVGNKGYDELYFDDYGNAFAGPGQFGYGLLPVTAPDPRVGRVNYLQSGAISNYNGVTVSLQENFWKGMSGRLNYTFSHAMDESSNGGVLPFSIYYSVLGQINPANLHDNYASSDYDARHQISGSYIYQLPFKASNRLLNLVVGGWQWSGTMFFRTGFPFSVFDSATVDTLTSQNLTGATVLLQPLFNRRNFGSVDACVSSPCFGIQGQLNTSAPYLFSPASSFSGAVGRNAFRGPGFLGGDMSLRKDFRINERMNFQLGLNAYNWFNHANYGAPISQTVFGPQFGQVLLTEAPPTSPYGAFASAATDMRMAQLTAKFVF
jgi:Carboxypeptidase regulatory-like domain/TonB-dependent Receptor Plug Domain